MIPVDQTVFTVPGGNCFSACIATLLDLSIDQVPYFMDPPARDWQSRLNEWLRPRGLYSILCLYAEEQVPAGFYILSGKSPRYDTLHSVVACGTQIVHDPHPDRTGIQSRVDALILVPFDLSAYVFLTVFP